MEQNVGTGMVPSYTGAVGIDAIMPDPGQEKFVELSAEFEALFKDDWAPNQSVVAALSGLLAGLRLAKDDPIQADALREVLDEVVSRVV